MDHATYESIRISRTRYKLDLCEPALAVFNPYIFTEQWSVARYSLRRPSVLFIAYDKQKVGDAVHMRPV